MEFEQLSSELAERLDRGEVSLPLLPAVATQVLGLVHDPDSDAGALSQLIQNDQALAGHVMKVANSPLLRAATPMVSLQQAITRLGMSTIGEIALTATMGPRLFKAPAFAPLIDSIWQQSLATAVWAKEIARSLRRNVELGFLCGLLHQIGKPVVLQAIQEINWRDVASHSDVQITRLLEMHSMTAGLCVVENWKLPELVGETIAWLDDYQSAPTAQELVTLIAAAHQLAEITLSDDSDDAAILELGILTELNMYSDDVEALLERKESVLASVGAMAL